MNGQKYLLTINVPPLLEEAIVDCLLAIESADGFSSLTVNAHGSDQEHISLAEQVAGTQKKTRFQMYIPEHQLSGLIDVLKRDFSGSGIHYWVIPILDSGYI